jgi:hypothetical protein
MAAKTPIEEKIAMLLAKAESTNSPHEAEALTEAAEKLMIKNGVTAAMLSSLNGGKVEKIITDTLHFAGIYGDTLMNYLGNVAEKLAPVRVYIMSTYSGVSDKRIKLLKIVGFESDVDRVMILLHSLERQALVAVKVFWKEHPFKQVFSGMEAFKERRQFIMSFCIAAGARIAANVNQEVRETTGAELVLVSRLDQVSTSDQMPTDLRAARGRIKGGTSHAHREGSIAGNNAATGEKGVGYGQLALGQ